MFVSCMSKSTHCRIMATLEGKGGGRKGRFQGKVTKLEKRGEAEEIVRDFLKNNK